MKPSHLPTSSILIRGILSCCLFLASATYLQAIELDMSTDIRVDEDKASYLKEPENAAERGEGWVYQKFSKSNLTVSTKISYGILPLGGDTHKSTEDESLDFPGKPGGKYPGYSKARVIVKDGTPYLEESSMIVINGTEYPRNVLYELELTSEPSSFESGQWGRFQITPKGEATYCEKNVDFLIETLKKEFEKEAKKHLTKDAGDSTQKGEADESIAEWKKRVKLKSTCKVFAAKPSKSKKIVENVSWMPGRIEVEFPGLKGNISAKVDI